MSSPRGPDPEPRVEAVLVPFAEGDFHALAPALARDPQYNDRRLELRRKLLALAKVFCAQAKDAGVALDARTSLHNPNTFNHMQVRRMWSYVCRPKAEKSRLRRTIGAELAKDLDSTYRNAYLCAAVETDAIEVSLRIHADAWFDGQNLVQRVRAQGVDGWKSLLNELDGFRLRLADWKGEWLCGALTRERIEEFLKYYKPGEHSLALEDRLAAPPGARGEALSSEMPARIVERLVQLLPMYRFAAWSEESDFLFNK